MKLVHLLFKALSLLWKFQLLASNQECWDEPWEDCWDEKKEVCQNYSVRSCQPVPNKVMLIKTS